jgi:ribose transport system ATP-binding protein
MTDLPTFITPFGVLKQKKMQKTTSEQVEALSIKTPSLVQKVKFLSGGNQQKVVIAKWLVKNCDVLFFDEPTRGIDVGAKQEIYQLLNELASLGKAIVMISSELPEILRMSDRIVVMCEGRITGELEGSTATEEAVMKLATQRETMMKTA